MKPNRIVLIPLAVCILVSLACNLPTATTSAAVPPPASTDTPASAGAATPTPSPTASPAPISHKLTPGAPPAATPVYDSESHSTSELRYASSGDLYDLNRFERPFTAKDMTYLTYLDIQSFWMTKDPGWYYASVDLQNLSGIVPGLEPVYAVELDYNMDGRGDFLIWAKPPFTTDWDTRSVSVYADTNHSVGGPHPEKADPSDKAGDGYEKLILDNGQGDDPDLAWVRISPDDAHTIQFAFKKTLIPGSSLEWAAWADAGLKDPAKFAYNDRMAINTAGSPLQGNTYYPLKDLYAVDNTCYEPFGATIGYLPLMCPHEEPTPTRRPAPPGSTPPPTKRPTKQPQPTPVPPTNTPPPIP